MDQVDISFRGPQGDCRYEQARSTSPSYVPSINLTAFMRSFEPEGANGKLRQLADRIDVGGATESEEEVETLYNALGPLLDQLEDLIDMCRRREEALTEAGIRFGVFHLP